MLRAGELVAFPTETVYGLGGDATNTSAIAKIFALKGRPASNPLIVHIASIASFSNVADLSNSTIRDRLEALHPFWPGPLSVVLPKKQNITSAVSAGGDTIAVRIPRHPVALALLKAAAIPIAAPSANPSGYVSPTTAVHVYESFGSAAPFILDGGACEVGIESTVVSLVDAEVTVLRPGAITVAMLEKVFGKVAVVSKSFTSEKELLLSPGQLASHYAPRTPVYFLSDIDPTTLRGRIGCISFSTFRPLPEIEFAALTTLSDSGKHTEIAENLFAALRAQDKLDLDCIVVDACEDIGLGAAIMDRLRRATTGRFQHTNRIDFKKPSPSHSTFSDPDIVK